MKPRYETFRSGYIGASGKKSDPAIRLGALDFL